MGARTADVHNTKHAATPWAGRRGHTQAGTTLVVLLEYTSWFIGVTPLIFTPKKFDGMFDGPKPFTGSLAAGDPSGSRLRGMYVSRESTPFRNHSHRAPRANRAYRMKIPA